MKRSPKYINKTIAAAVLCVVALAGCGSGTGNDTADSAAKSTTTVAAATEASVSSTTAAASSDAATTTAANATETTAASTSTQSVAAEGIDHHDSEADHKWSDSDVQKISLDDSDGTVEITKGGTYELSGTLAGQVVVNSTDDQIVRIILSDATINSASGPAINVTAAEEVMVVLADGTTNTLTDAASAATTTTAATGTETETDTPNAALYSAADLTITGNGKLSVTGNAEDGITGKDGLVITSGDITVTAADDGIRGKDYLVVEGGTINVDAAGHALQSDLESTEAKTSTGSTTGFIVIAAGDLTLKSGEDALHSNGAINIDGGTLKIAAGDDAVHSDATLKITGGTIDVTESYEGLESANITISGGTANVVTSDDGINISGGNDSSQGQGPGGGGDSFDSSNTNKLTISGGTVTVNSGGDGLDANGSIEITGGTTVVYGPTENMNGALDVDGTFTVAEGTLVAIGSAGMAEAPETSTGNKALNIRTSVSAGQTIKITAEDGTPVAEVTSPKQAQSIVVSSPKLVESAAYNVIIGGADQGTVTAV